MYPQLVPWSQLTCYRLDETTYCNTMNRRNMKGKFKYWEKQFSLCHQILLWQWRSDTTNTKVCLDLWLQGARSYTRAWTALKSAPWWDACYNTFELCFMPEVHIPETISSWMDSCSPLCLDGPEEERTSVLFFSCNIDSNWTACNLPKIY